MPPAILLRVRLGFLDRFADEGFQCLEADGFGQVGFETGFFTAGEVFVLAETTDGDAFHAAAEAAHDVVTGAVGEAEVGDEQVELFQLGNLHRLGDTADGLHAVTHAFEQARQGFTCVDVIFYVEDFLLRAWRDRGIGDAR